MYLWKIDKLKKDLIQQPLSERESIQYVIATFMLTSVGIIMQLLQNDRLSIYATIAMSIITVLGVYYAYISNGGAKGEYFLQKYFSLGFVLFIRWIIFILLPSTIVYSIAIVLFLGQPDHRTIVHTRGV